MGTSNTYGFHQGFISMPPSVKILFVFLAILILLFVSSILSALLAVPIFGYSLMDILEIISNPDQQSLVLVKYFQIIQSVFIFIVPAILVAWLFSTNAWKYLKTTVRPSIITIILILISIVIAIPALNALTIMNSQMDLPDWLDSVEQKIVALEESATRLTELFLESKSYSQFALNLFMIAVLPAIGEEFLFRGVFQRLFTEWTRNRHWGILLAAFLFSFFHFQFYGFLPRFVLGVYFGYLLLWSGTIWMPVAAHFINNCLAVIYYHFSSKPIGETMLDNIGTDNESAYALILSVVFTGLLLFLIYHYERTRNRSYR